MTTTYAVKNARTAGPLMENAPPLPDLDAALYAGRKMPPHVRRERRIAWNLLSVLSARGFEVNGVFDGEWNVVSSPVEAMSLMFNLDESIVAFKRGNDSRYWVKFVNGNDLDLISDYYADDGEFAALIDAFDAEQFA